MPTQPCGLPAVLQLTAAVVGGLGYDRGGLEVSFDAKLSML